MKRALIIAFAAALLCVSCSEFLNIRPEGTTTALSLDHSKAENVFKPVSAAYAELRSYGSHSFPYIGCLEITSDNADKGSTPEDGASMKQLDEFKYDAANELIVAQWEAYYNIVSAANNALAQMDLFIEELQSEDAKDLARQGIGDAKFIRAYAYFRLVTMFGNIPLVDGIKSSEELASLKQEKPSVIWNFIEEDLTDAISRLPESWPSTYRGRATKYSAMALKAKAHLYQGEYDDVAKLCDEIIASGKFDLLPDFRSVFSIEQENGVESLFEIQSSDLGKSSGTEAFNTYAYVQGPRNNTPSNMQGWGFCVPSDALIQFLTDRNDAARAAATFLYSGTTTPEGDAISADCPNPVYNGKVYTPSSYNDWGNNGYGYDYNIRIIRYSDVLLMYAEALARNASSVGLKSGYSASDALNEVRNRAGMTDIAATVDNVLDERRAEFALEEDRFIDLVRTGKAAEVLGPLGYVEGKHNLFPIPSKQLQLNSNLTQNPNY
ncbi:MAG: RagB/SusD family nutrient uptake outer membrane protein [Bacteroidales bacterium]|nr:RagB/SusD family nutrient uptake outer membrane protein [Bacteroidales bacterium]